MTSSPTEYNGEEGDIVYEPYGDESPDALCQVVPADKTKQPFWLPRSQIVGLSSKNRFSVNDQDVPEQITPVASLGPDWERSYDRPSALAAILIGAGSGFIVGVAVGSIVSTLWRATW